jgi:hypothetical protein
MIVRLNGQFFMEIGSVPQGEVFVIKKGINPKLKTLAATLWSLSGTMFAKAQVYAASGELWEQGQPLIYFFQDMAMFLGVFAIIAGLILLAVKKRWGVATLKVTSFIVIGAFMAPAALMLLAILGHHFNDALTEVLSQMRENKVPVMGGK